jgi:hypothetical protein
MTTKKHRSFLACVVFVAILGASWLGAINVHAQDSTVNKALFNSDGSVNQPEGWRRWVFVGSPLTPNALNGGNAPFPEFHNVYVEPSAFDVYEATGEWPEGTQIVKELTSIYENNNDEMGASMEVSGRGFQQGEFKGWS